MNNKVLQEAIAECKEASERLVMAQDYLDALAGQALQGNVSHGTQANLARDLDISREKLRHVKKLGYYRSVARFGPNGEAWITAPVATIKPEVEWYEIRMPKRGEVIGRVSGKELYRIAREQEQQYIAEDPENHRRIRLVEVSDYIRIGEK